MAGWRTTGSKRRAVGSPDSAREEHACADLPSGEGRREGCFRGCWVSGTHPAVHPAQAKQMLQPDSLHLTAWRWTGGHHQGETPWWGAELTLGINY